ncbi:Rid family hydrolase [Curtobacterium sp. YR515]|uniref:Rid family hydrolase n=1 Tax=Curtobacterium sp. YR515 TaxID=1855316 RepID=UPI0008E9A798|nr:Rid family hydrolase [Curtobacterium sp. YR515]SFF73851.1 Enamine deaminase RidA, house cleaning of reactive enamine intermediates, YjgF/YER057c/UK114 family [Curtobacterium sp. YR515]
MIDSAGTTPEFFATDGYGQTARDTVHASQAVRIGQRVETSGQGGWDDSMQIADTLEEQMRRAFDNVERTLAAAGASWHDVVDVTSFHLPEDGVIGAEDTRLMVQHLHSRMGARRPIWTQIGAPAFGLPGMRVEIRVTAIIDRHTV